MTTAIVNDHYLVERLRAERAATGADRYDEVWEGVYIMSPIANNEHQELIAFLTEVLGEIVRRGRLGIVLPGTNITDREDDWTQNYRVPDVAVFLNSTRAQNRGTHWLGGPDFGIEIVSPDDNSHEKIPFYESVNTRELLILDRDPWSLEMFRLEAGQLLSAGKVVPNDPNSVVSGIVGLTFQLVSADERPGLIVKHSVSDKEWRE